MHETSNERRRLVTLLMRSKFLAKRIATITDQGGMASWDQAELEALTWVCGKLRASEPDLVAAAERKAEERRDEDGLTDEEWKAWAGGEACEVDRLRGALERADEEVRSIIAERDSMRAKLEAMAVERARLVVAWRSS